MIEGMIGSFLVTVFCDLAKCGGKKFIEKYYGDLQKAHKAALETLYKSYSEEEIKPAFFNSLYLNDLLSEKRLGDIVSSIKKGEIEIQDDPGVLTALVDEAERNCRQFGRECDRELAHKILTEFYQSFFENIQTINFEIFVRIDACRKDKKLDELPEEFRQILREENKRIIEELKLPTPSTGIPWNVPFRKNINFTGRDEEMEKLRDELESGARAVISQVISGMGGVGKTQLAVEYCHKFKENYPGGVLWVTGVGDIFTEYAKIEGEKGLRLGLPETMPPQDKCVQVQLCLQRRKDETLLVLDNLDEKKAYDEVRPYLPVTSTSACHILITTRRTDLEDGAGLSLDIFTNEKALELLEKECGRVAEDEGTSQNICLILGNLPLAIEAAGKYLKEMRVVSLPEYYRELIDIGAVSHESLHDNDGKVLLNTDHIASVKATFLLNRELSGNSQITQILTALLCFVPDSINPELLALVCGKNWQKEKKEVWKLITVLGKYSIVQIQEDNRLNIHRLMREALREQMPEDDMKAMLKEYVINLEKWFSEYNEVDALKITIPEISHFLEAANLALEKGIWPQSYDWCIELAKYYDFIGFYQQSLDWAKKSEAEVKANAPHDQVKHGLSSNWIGSILNSLGCYKDAIPYYKQTLAIYKGVLGEKHQRTASCLNNLGEAWMSLGKNEKAIEFYQQALEIVREVNGERHPKVAICLNNLGVAWYALKKFKKAIEFYQQALGIWREVYGEKHPQVAVGLNNLGSVWWALGNNEKAIEFYQQALVIDRDVYGERHPNVARELHNLGTSWKALGKNEKAREHFQQAYSIWVEYLGEDHPNTQTVKKWLDSL